MNKCSNCGSDFEGKFCPICGEKHTENEDVKLCPNCGAELKDYFSFCNECGYSFKEAPKKSNQQRVQNTAWQNDGLARKTKVHNSCLYIPVICMILFTVLLLVCFSLPVVNMVLDEGMSTSLGNVWEILDRGLFDVPQASTICIVLFILLIVSVALSIAMIVVCKKKTFVYNAYNLFLGFSLVIYIPFAVLGFVIINYIKKADEGMGIFEHGLSPVLLIAFSCTFFAISAIALICRKLMLENDFLLKKQEEEFWSEEKARIDLFYATHEAPKAPDINAYRACNLSRHDWKTDYIYYKHCMRKYSKAQEGYPSSLAINLDYYKVPIVVAVIIIAALITSIVIYNDTFRTSRVDNIEIGFSQKEVLDILGEPYAESRTDFKWEYFGGSYARLLKKIDKNLEEQEKYINDEEKLLDLVAEETALLAKLESSLGKYIEIQFDSDKKVTSVILDKKYTDNEEATITKKLKKITLSDNQVPMFADKYALKITAAYYYTDGSYKLTTLPSNAFDKLDTSKAGKQTIEWSDDWGNYECEVEISEELLSGTVNNIAYKITPSERDANGNQHLVLTLGNDGTINIKDEESIPWKKYNSLVEEIIVVGDVSDPYGVLKKFTNLHYATISASIDISVESLEELTVTSGEVKQQFENAKKLKKLNLYDGVSVQTLSFYYCNQLEELIVGGSSFALSSHESYLVFTHDFLNSYDYEFDKMTDAVITGTNFSNPLHETRGYDNLEQIIINYDYAIISKFSNCPKLSKISVAGSIKSIYANAFEGCAFPYENGLCYVDNWLVGYDGISSNVTIKKGAKMPYNSNSIFSNCYTLKSINILADIDITSEMFIGCTSLETVSIAGNTTKIGDSAFKDLSSLKSITIPDSVTSISSSAFKGCSSLTSITLGDSVTSISSSAFEGCSSLTSINIPDSVTSIGKNAFCGCSSLTSVTIPDSVTSIDSYAFYGCSSLTSVTIGDGVTSIGYEAFRYCSSLTSITLGDSVTSIGYEAFYNCSSLTSINIPDSVTSIGYSAFEGCSSLTSVTIPDSVTSISSSEFEGCSSLTSVTIPDSVTSIGYHAFKGCSSLTSITFNGTKAEWKAISKDIFWNSFIGKFTIYCTDGTIAE